MSQGNIRYWLKWDFKSAGSDIRGTTLTSQPSDLDFNKKVCQALCEDWGPGTHWLEDEAGERVES